MKNRNKSKQTPSKEILKTESSDEEEIVDNQSVEDSEIEAEDQNDNNDSEIEAEEQNDNNDSEIEAEEQNDNNDSEIEAEEMVEEQEDDHDSEIEAAEMAHDQNGDHDFEMEAGSSSEDEARVKKKKKGIIYISSIPKYMNVTILREMLSEFARIGRIFLQPGKLTNEELNRKKKRKRLAKHFTEGWVEFDSKRAAKRVAALLNNKPIATRKSSKFYDISWVMKYLPRFKWVHLSERLTYENAVHRQKLQSEISQARKETTFFKDNLDRSEKLRKTKKKPKKANAGFVEADA